MVELLPVTKWTF